MMIIKNDTTKNYPLYIRFGIFVNFLAFLGFLLFFGSCRYSFFCVSNFVTPVANMLGVFGDTLVDFYPITVLVSIVFAYYGYKKTKDNMGFRKFMLINLIVSLVPLILAIILLILGAFLLTSLR